MLLTPVILATSLMSQIPMITERAAEQALMLDRVMSERPAIGDWKGTPKAKGTQGVVGETSDSQSAFPRSWTRGTYKVEPSIGWTTGFYPGELWLIYHMTGKEEFKSLAEKWTEKLESARHYRLNHDLGFMFLCSYGLGIKYGGHGEDYAAVIRDAAKALASRYDEKMGMIRSWDEPRFMRFPVIVDSMMNLEMMMQYGYKDIALSHADKINKSHYRPNGTAYHVTDWNPATGKIFARYAWQGACVEGAWSRGQGWSVYGFTMMARETGRKDYLERAVKSADWILGAPTPEDGVPYWDYAANGVEDGSAPRDASAAAIIASALVELSTMDVPRAKEYLAHAEKILLSLSSDEYLSKSGENGGFLLKHSTGSFFEDTEVDASINYADYYYLEAIARYVDLKNQDR